MPGNSDAPRQYYHLLTDCGVIIAPLCCASQNNSVKIWDDVKLAIVVHVVLDPGGLDPDHLTPTRQHSPNLDPAGRCPIPW